MHGADLMAFKADLYNVNWNSINHYPETISKHKTLKYSLSYTKNTFL